MSTPSSIHSEVLGSGAPLVILHGWGHSAARTRGLGEVLSAYFQVHLLDLPGFGDSPALERGAGLDEYAAAVLGYLDSRDLQTVLLFGHSFGGQIAVRLAARHPERVKELCLIGATGLPRRRTLKQKLRFVVIATARWITKKIDTLFRTDIFRSWLMPKIASADYLNAGDLRPTMVRVIHQHVTEDARAVVCPTLLLWGSNDTETPVSMGRDFAHLLRRSTLKILMDKGHVPFDGVGAHLCAYHWYTFHQTAGAA